MRAFPFQDEVIEFIDRHEKIFVIEQNRDAQLRTMLMTEDDVSPEKLQSVLYFDGLPITADFITDNIRTLLDKDHQASQRFQGRKSMSFERPNFRHPKLATNSAGYSRKDYEGAISTLCAGCGHDSTTSCDHPGLF